MQAKKMAILLCAGLLVMAGHAATAVSLPKEERRSIEGLLKKAEDAYAELAGLPVESGDAVRRVASDNHVRAETALAGALCAHSATLHRAYNAADAARTRLERDPGNEAFIKEAEATMAVYSRELARLKQLIAQQADNIFTAEARAMEEGAVLDGVV
jgi:hypothetical protein